MSAFLVSNTHINALVRWASLKDVTVYHGNPSHRWQVAGSEQEIAEALLSENVKSVQHRYDDEVSAQSIVYNSAVRLLTPVEVLKSVQCLKYQSNEHPEWKASLSYAVCHGIEQAAIKALPGYGEAPWGIED